MSLTSSFAFLPRGAVIQEFKVGGRNVVLGFRDPESYAASPFFGETIGRVANRIKDGVINDLNGKSYQLGRNNDPNHLHGGQFGWGKKEFSGPKWMTRDGKETVQFTYVSPDGDEGYPGTVELRVWYSASEEQEDGASKIVLVTEYEVELIGDECNETTVNITNHSYFNISGGSTIEGTECVLATSKYLEVDETDIPTEIIGDFPSIEVNRPFKLGPQEPNIDHCFVLNPEKPDIPLDTRQEPVNKQVSLFHPNTGLHLEVFSTEPAFQFYTGKYIDVPATNHSPAMGQRAGLCIEPSRYINAINVPQWRSQTLLQKGKLYGAKNIYKAWKA